jgi:alpha-methylacyl-CoA racemase
LDFDEALTYPHNVERQSFVTTDGLTHPAPTPRLSRTPGVAGAIPETGSDTVSLLRALGYSADDITRLRAAGTIG